MFAVANPPIVSVYASDDSNTVTVEWSLPRGGDEVIGYYVFYNHPSSNVTIVKENADATSATFIEGNALQRVYSVSIQALSLHLPSIVVGPVTVRS